MMENALDDLPEGYAPAVVPDGHQGGALGEVLRLDDDPGPRAHDEFVDRVVHDLLEEDIDPVVGIGPVPEAADIHSRPEADVLEGGEGLDLGLVVTLGCWLCHDCRNSSTHGLPVKRSKSSPELPPLLGFPGLSPGQRTFF